MKFTASIRKFTLALAIISILMTIISFTGNLGELYWNNALYLVVDILETHDEGTIPVWFSVANLLLSAALFWIVGAKERENRSPYASHWILLSMIFIGLSIDEMLALHERLIEPLRETFSTSGFLTSAWVLAAIPFLLIFLLIYIRFLLHLPKETRRGMIVAGIVFIGGAVGIEMFTAYYVQRFGNQNLAYFTLTNFEEFCEMIGIIILIDTLLRYIRSFDYLRIEFSR